MLFVVYGIYASEYMNKIYQESIPIIRKNEYHNDLTDLLFNFALEYAIRKEQETNLGLDMNGTHQVLAYADNVNLIGDDIRTIEMQVIS